MIQQITVNAYEIALQFKRNKLVKVITEGNYWASSQYEITKVKMTQIMIVDRDWELILTNPLLKDYVEFVDVGDNQLGIEMINAKFNRVLPTGKYAYWKNALEYAVEIIDLDDVEVSTSIPRYTLMKAAMQPYFNAYTVESYQKGILFIDGTFAKELNPGVYYFWKTDKIPVVKTVDIRIQQMELNGQEILTKDKAGIRINFSIQYQIEDIQKAIVDTNDFVKQLYTNLQMILREYIGTMTLDQLLANKEDIGPFVINRAKSISQMLGLNLLSGGIKDVILPGDIKDIMNQVLIAQKKAQANTIMRQEETASTRSLLNTAKLMEQNTMLLKLKEMEYLEKIADKIGEISVNGKGRIVDQLTDLFINSNP